MGDVAEHTLYLGRRSQLLAHSSLLGIALSLLVVTAVTPGSRFQSSLPNSKNEVATRQSKKENKLNHLRHWGAAIGGTLRCTKSIPYFQSSLPVVALAMTSGGRYFAVVAPSHPSQSSLPFFGRPCVCGGGGGTGGLGGSTTSIPVRATIHRSSHRSQLVFPFIASR